MVLVVMTCETDFLKKCKSAADALEFPFLPPADDESIIAGAFRASGYTAQSGVALVVEQVAFDDSNGIIECLAQCVATFDTGVRWIAPVDGVVVTLEESQLQTFGSVLAKTRNGEVEIVLDKDDLVNNRYLESQSTRPTTKAITLKVVDTVERDLLFGTERGIADALGFPTDAERVFVIDRWEHPSEPSVDDPALDFPGSFDPTDWPDLVAIAKALCSGEARPQLSGRVNTEWGSRFMTD